LDGVDRMFREKEKSADLPLSSPSGERVPGAAENKKDALSSSDEENEDKREESSSSSSSSD
jgi:hypothetical protein